DMYNRQTHYIEIFNKGTGPLDFKATTDHPWIVVNKIKGPFDLDYRLSISIKWSNLPEGLNEGNILISGTGKEVNVGISAFKPKDVIADNTSSFIEGEGVVSIEAEHFTKNTDAGDSQWGKIEDYGHTLSAMRAFAPVNTLSATPGKNSPCLEYKMYLFRKGTFDVTAIFAPTLNYIEGRGLKYGISFDDQIPQVVTLVPENYDARNGNRDWEKTVSDNARFSYTNHTLLSPGYHTLKIWMVDPGVVLQKIIVNTGGLRPSYLGPPESYRTK
ncbi:MAG: hypothetical protein WAL29_03300, partial [Bacteroidales bacterium]